MCPLSTPPSLPTIPLHFKISFSFSPSYYTLSSCKANIGIGHLERGRKGAGRREEGVGGCSRLRRGADERKPVLDVNEMMKRRKEGVSPRHHESIFLFVSFSFSCACVPSRRVFPCFEAGGIRQHTHLITISDASSPTETETRLLVLLS